jgi:hypothetical protein
MTRPPAGSHDPAAARGSRIPRLAEQAGFGLVEAIASAAVLAFLALGVLAGVDGAAGSTGREKARAVAGALAEQDQERLHGMRVADLPDHRWTRPVTVDGAEYTVDSQVEWVSDSTGSEVSCTSNGGKADFLRLRTTVTSRTVGAAVAPVRIDSLIAPPIGAAGGNNGTLSVKVENRDAMPATGLAVTVTGTSFGHSASRSTNAKGCAVFANVPADEYTVALPAGYVDKEGASVVTTKPKVTAGNTTMLPLLYDHQASVAVSFQTQYLNRAAGNAPKLAPSRGWSVSLTNSGMKTNVGRRVLVPSAGAPQATLTATNVFPFANGYGVFAGSCAEEAQDTAWAQNTGELDPGASLSTTVRQPALSVRIANGTRGSNPQRGKANWIGGANVQARLVVTEATSDCRAAPETLPGIRLDATNGLQSYPAGEALSGTLSTTSNYDDGFTGFVTKRAPGQNWSTGSFDPGLPWGTWQVCADSGGRRNFATVVNKRPEGTANYATIDIAQANPTDPAQNSRCTDVASWPAPALPGWGA